MRQPILFNFSYGIEKKVEAFHTNFALERQ